MPSLRQISKLAVLCLLTTAQFLAHLKEHTSSPTVGRSLFHLPLLLLMIGEFLSPPLFLSSGPEGVIKKDLPERDTRMCPDDILGPYPENG